MKKKQLFKIVAAAVLATTVVAGLTACTKTLSTSISSCAWVVGNGKDNNDATINKTAYPGQQVKYDDDKEVVRYIPCGQRNYLITDGTDKGLGDLETPIEARTKQNTPVLVTVNSLWELNQSTLDQFAVVCDKYDCSGTSPNSASSGTKSATDGWIKMLRENFGPAIKDAVQETMPSIDDSIWKSQDPTQKKLLEEKLSTAFMDSIRKYTGLNKDLFCGSGNSGWNNPKTPGKGGYTCSNVRFASSNTVAADAQTQQNATSTNQTQLDIDANAARFKKSQALYGSQTNYWLGVQDAASKCPSGATCNIYLGNPPQN